ncbi:MAG: phosphoribosylglycinamide formyltransferase, partial [Candidatus Marinimicrobia bacterium]|nr:phosphoribosylglycinamide formyltransferase [Candidatus Neomarinimicrobiota bacterium]
MKNLAVFVSGRGSNFRAIHKAVGTGEIEATVALVVTHDLTCEAALWAADQGLVLLQYPGDAQPEDLLGAMTAARIDFGILAGYIKLVPALVVAAYRRRIVNIHPAPLPQFGGPGFYGSKVHAEVLRSGVKLSGPTVHFVDEQYDRGAVLATIEVPVLPDDDAQSLARRVLEQEHILYPRVVAALCQDRLVWDADGRPTL